MNDYDRQEDVAALKELVQDVEGEMAYLEFNYEYGFEESANA